MICPKFHQIPTYIVFIFPPLAETCKEQIKARKQWLERAERIGNRKEEFPAILGAVKHQTCLENAISDP